MARISLPIDLFDSSALLLSVWISPERPGECNY